MTYCWFLIFAIFSPYENRKLKFFYAINVHSESMNQALFLFRDRMFSCETPFFSFLGRTMVWSLSLGFLLVDRTLLHSPLAVPTSPALGHDFSLFCSSLTSYPVLDERAWNAVLTLLSVFVFILVPLLTAYVAYSRSLRALQGWRNHAFRRPVCSW